MDNETLRQCARCAWNEDTPGGLRPTLEELVERVISLQQQVDNLTRTDAIGRQHV